MVKLLQSNLSIVVTQGTEPKLATIDRWPLYPGLEHILFVWPICLCMIDIYRCYESCSSQNIVLHLMHKHGRNKLITAFWLFYVVENTRSIILDLGPFSFHRLNDRHGKIRLHAVNDTTTAKIYKWIFFLICQFLPTTDDVFKFAQAIINHNFLSCILPDWKKTPITWSVHNRQFNGLYNSVVYNGLFSESVA